MPLNTHTYTERGVHCTAFHEVRDTDLVKLLTHSRISLCLFELWLCLINCVQTDDGLAGIDLSMPLRADEVMPVRSHRVVKATDDKVKTKEHRHAKHHKVSAHSLF